MEKSATQWMVEPIRKYASFSGRARRAEYWWFQLFFTLLFTVLTIVDMMVFGFDPESGDPPTNLFVGLAALALVIPSIAVGVRRLHDRDKSGWWLLWGLLPLIGGLILLYQYVQRGTVGDNRFGPDPLAGGD
jgi:uncharacterized membrane protein YhaH (DUF805 family)